MKVKVLTTLSNSYWEKTGQYTVKFWEDHIPKDWEVWLHDTPDLGVRCDKLLESKDKSSWIDQAANIVSQIPEEKHPHGYYKEWLKFCHKSFAQWESYETEPSGILIWIDADVVLKKPLDMSMIEKGLGGKFCGYFGRDRVDPSTNKKVKRYGKFNVETGVIFYNLDHLDAKKFFDIQKNIYLSNEVFNLYDWADTGVFETAMVRTGKESFHDITGHLPPTTEPIPISFLDEYVDHWMGTSNKEARSDISGKALKQKMIRNGLLSS